MVKIPTSSNIAISERRFEPQQISGVSADAFGASQGRALQTAGQSLRQVSEVAFNIQDDLDTLELQKLAMAHSKSLSDIGYGENGYFAKVGDVALNDFAITEKTIDDISKSTLETASNDRVKEQLSNVMLQKNLNMREGMLRHWSKNKTTALISGLDGIIEQSGNDASLAYNNEKEFQRYMNTIKINAEELAIISSGLSGEAKTLFVNQKLSEQYAKVVDRIINDNPVEALDFLERPAVKSSLEKAGTYQKIKTLADNKILNLGKRAEQQTIINGTRQNNGIIEKAANGEMSIEMIEKLSVNWKPAFKNHVLKTAGYSKAKEVKLTDSEKLEQGSAFQDAFWVFMDNKKSKTADDWQGFHNRLLEAVDKGVISKAEYTTYYKELVEPYNKRIEKDLETFNKDYLGIDTSLGFKEIEKYYNDNIEITSWYVPDSDEEKLADKRNKLRLNTLYMKNLRETAKENNLSLGELSMLTDNEKHKYLAGAVDKTIIDYANTLGNGSFDDVNKAKVVIGQEKQKETRIIINNKINKAYETPKEDTETDIFLKEFGL